MYHRTGIDFFDTFQYSLAKFLPGLHPDVPKKRSGHFSEQRLDDVQPGSMGRREHVLKSVGAGCQKRPRLFGNVCRVIVQDKPDRPFGWVVGVQILQQRDELPAAVTPFDSRRHMAVVQIQPGQNRAGPQALVFVIARYCGVLAPTGGKSGAVLAIACRPGFSSTETVTTTGVSPPLFWFCRATS